MSGIDISKYKPAGKQAVKKEAGKGIADILNKDISLFGSGWNNAQLERFYSELNILLFSGLDIKTALELIEADQPKLAQREMVKKIKDDIIAGKSMYQALHDTGNFSPYEYYSIKIGEETGRLSAILEDLVKYYGNRIKQQRQLVSVFSYPAIVTLTAVLAVVFMLNFIVPLFADVFKRFGGELPWLTKFILQLSNGFNSHFYILVLLVIGFVAIAVTQKRKEWYRRTTSRMVMRIPIIGDIMQKVYLARFCQVMTLLMAAKVPMLHAIDLVGKMISFYPLEQSLKQVEKDILAGIPLHKSLEQFPIYNRRLVSLIKVGEEVNQLDTIFEKLSAQLSTEVEHKTSLLSSLLEPLLIIFLALIVGVILIAMYLPMFQLSVNIK